MPCKVINDGPGRWDLLPSLMHILDPDVPVPEPYEFILERDQRRRVRIYHIGREKEDSEYVRLLGYIVKEVSPGKWVDVVEFNPSYDPGKRQGVVAWHERSSLSLED